MGQYYKKQPSQHEAHGLEVRVNYRGTTPQERDQDLEKAIALFKKLVTREGLMVELREREYFRSDPEKRRDKRKKALQRLRKKERKNKFKKDFKDNKDSKHNDFRNR